MKNFLIILIIVMAALVLTGNAEAKNRRHHNGGNGGNNIIVPFPFFPIPVPVIPYDNNYDSGYRYRNHRRCGWITMDEVVYDRYGNPIMIERQVYHCQGQRY